MQTKFSVIITTYNRAHLLKRALNSLLLQTEKDWEAIVVDDGSTDNTEEVLSSFLKYNYPFQYFKQKNRGDAVAKNQGASLSIGEYITFLDSDDAYKPNHLASRRIILENETDISLLHGGVEIIGSEYVPDMHHPSQFIHLSECAIGGTFFIKREVMLALKGFKNIRMGADADFLERTAGAGFKIVKVNEPTYIYYRTSTDSITNNP